VLCTAVALAVCVTSRAWLRVDVPQPRQWHSGVHLGVSAAVERQQRLREGKLPLEIDIKERTRRSVRGRVAPLSGRALASMRVLPAAVCDTGSTSAPLGSQRARSCRRSTDWTASTFKIRCVSLDCAVPCRAVPCRAVPCRAVPCRAVPCRAVPCRAVRCGTCGAIGAMGVVSCCVVQLRRLELATSESSLGVHLLRAVQRLPADVFIDDMIASRTTMSARQQQEANSSLFRNSRGSRARTLSREGDSPVDDGELSDSTGVEEEAVRGAAAAHQHRAQRTVDAAGGGNDDDDDDDDDDVVGARRSAFSDLAAESSIESVGASDAEEGSGVLQPQLDWSV
jgi:hypothetical protein